VKTRWLVPALLAAVLGIAVADSDSGIPMWFRLREDAAQAALRVAALTRETEALGEQIAALRTEPFALERAIREDLELALPGEVIVRFHRAGGDW
jgi:cell division protein FtsB